MPYNYLLASWGSAGDFGPLLMAGRQLRARGHGVRFIARAGFCQEIKAAGFGATAWQRTSRDALDRDAAASEHGIQDPPLIGHNMCAPAAAYAADTRDELERVPTDALLAIDVLLGSAMAAEAAGIPCALLSPHVSIRPLPGVPSFGSGLVPAKTPDERAKLEAAQHWFAGEMNRWLPVLNKARAEQGLDPLDRVIDQYDRPERVLLAIGSAFDFPAEPLPENYRYVGPMLSSPGWAKPWVSPWTQQSGRPRALVSFTSLLDGGPETRRKTVETLQRVVNAIGAIDMDAIVTLGPALAGAVLHAPENVTLLDSAPHDAVMKEVSLVVTHGGHGAISRALLNGLPLIVLPMGRDQGDNALRIEFHGAGINLPQTSCEAEIGAAVNRLIKEPRFRAAARRLGEAASAEINSAKLVREMETIAGFPRG